MHKKYEQLRREGKIEFNPTFRALCSSIRHRLRLKTEDGRDNIKDIVIAIAGPRGYGKSTLEIHMGYLIDDHFEMKKNMSIISNISEIEEKFNNLKPKSVMGIDEAIRSLFKQNFMEKLQQTIVKMLDTGRFKNLCIIACTSRFKDLAETFRNNRVNILIQLTEAGRAVAIEKDPNPFSSDPWWVEGMRKMIGKKRNIDIHELIKHYHPGYLCEFTFPILPKEIEDEYLEFKLMGNDTSTTKEEKLNISGKLYKDALQKLLLYTANNHLKGEKKLMDVTGLSRHRIKELLREFNLHKEELNFDNNKPITTTLNTTPDTTPNTTPDTTSKQVSEQPIKTTTLNTTPDITQYTKKSNMGENLIINNRREDKKMIDLDD